MRLSEIKGERTLDVVAAIAGPLLSIAMDKDAAALFDMSSLPKNEDKRRAALVGRLRDSLPKLVNDHRDELVAILAALEGVPVDEYVEGLTMSSLLGGIFEMLTDEELLSFLS